MTRVAIAQIAPVFLDRERTIEKILERMREAAARGCRLVAFSETLVPGYPVWLERSGGARFDDPDQKTLHAHYLDQAVDLEAGHLDPIRKQAAIEGLHVILGVAERATDRGGHTIYCSCVVIDDTGNVASVHRKLMPTHEERLAWGHGDGAGLQVHDFEGFRLGALNCWENWMPLARAALQAEGEDLHVALWPGRPRNTVDISRFIALEGRSYVLSASGLLRAGDIPRDTALRETFVQSEDETILDGGSTIVGPDGSFIVEPCVGEEKLIVADIDPMRIRAERQNFDPAGHYARPDVFNLRVDRRRQRSVDFLDD